MISRGTDRTHPKNEARGPCVSCFCGSTTVNPHLTSRSTYYGYKHTKHAKIVWTFYGITIMYSLIFLMGTPIPQKIIFIVRRGPGHHKRQA